MSTVKGKLRYSLSTVKIALVISRPISNISVDIEENIKEMKNGEFRNIQ